MNLKRILKLDPDRISLGTNIALIGAIRFAVKNKSSEVYPEHIIYSLFTMEDAVLPLLISNLGGDPEEVISSIEKRIKDIQDKKRVADRIENVKLSFKLRRIINEALKESEMRGELLCNDHLMVALFKEKGGLFSEILLSNGIKEFDVKPFNCGGCPNVCEDIIEYIVNGEVIGRYGGICGTWRFNL
jgi:ATP-dependent Clp protease ATP-binding subunit ClpA